MQLVVDVRLSCEVDDNVSQREALRKWRRINIEHEFYI